MQSTRRFLLIVIILFLFFSLSKNIFDYHKTVSFYESYKSDYEKEKKSNITLKTMILKNNDPSELEKTIRNRLNLLKNNEVAVIIPQPTPTVSPASAPVLPIYQQWLMVFFKN